MFIIPLAVAFCSVIQAVNAEEEIALNFDFEKIHSKAIAAIESHASSIHLKVSLRKVNLKS